MTFLCHLFSQQHHNISFHLEIQVFMRKHGRIFSVIPFPNRKDKFYSHKVEKSLFAKAVSFPRIII
jgi:hypothetical protein